MCYCVPVLCNNFDMIGVKTKICGVEFLIKLWQRWKKGTKSVDKHIDNIVEIGSCLINQQFRN